MDQYFTNLVSVYTDGAPSKTGKSKGCVAKQQNLCFTLNKTLKKNDIVNFIWANATRDCQFQEMLMLDDEIISVDLPYHAKKHWLLWE